MPRRKLPKGFYNYVYLREDNTPYYVGKGKGNRAYKKHEIVGVPSDNRIVIYLADSEQDAIETEIALIWYYGRKDTGTGCLRNFTDGGEGTSGYFRSVKQAHCKRGHERTTENVGRAGQCVVCERERGLKRAKSRKVGRPALTLLGKRFGKLLVIARSIPFPAEASVMWECLCDCGKTAIVSGSNLSLGHQSTCGCSRFMRCRGAGGRYV